MSDDLEIPMPVYRVPRRRAGIDPATRRLMMIAGGLGAGLLLVVGIARLGGHHHGGVPVIEAESGPVRVRPADPGGMSVTGQDDEILSDQTGTSRDKLAPAAEAPSLQALHAQEQADAARAEPPAPHEAAPSAPAAPPAAPPIASETRTAPVAQPVSVPAQPATHSATPPAGAAAPIAGVHESALPAAAPAAAAPTHRAASAAASGHAAEVQLGALASEAAAHQEWTRLAHRLPDLLGDRTPVITRLDRDGRTLWRLRTGGFGDLADATQFCQRVRAKGQACSIAAF